MMFISNQMPSEFTDKDGIFYNHHTDFREWMRFESLINDKDVPEYVLSTLVVKLIFPIETPPITEALEYISWFYNCGKIPKPKSSNSVNGSRSVPYNLIYDFDFIYAAFLEQYNIDLIDIPYLHWWKFSALLKSLHDCKFTEIVSCRNTTIDDDLPESYKCHVLDMQEAFELPMSVSEELQRAKAIRFLNS